MIVGVGEVKAGCGGVRNGNDGNPGALCREKAVRGVFQDEGVDGLYLERVEDSLEQFGVGFRVDHILSRADAMESLEDAESGQVPLDPGEVGTRRHGES